MQRINIKICGMRNISNIAEVVRLKPDYIGFILYPGSPRYMDLQSAGKLIKLIPATIKKVGVIVNEPVDRAIMLVQSGFFDMLQLHGDEDMKYCSKLSKYIDLIKAFRIGTGLPTDLACYQPYCRMFLFDSAGKSFGGNGIKFDHTLLQDYNLKTKFLLGGGISAEDIALIRNIRNESFSGVDLNSRFEIIPGIKDVPKLKKFIKKIRSI